jgi:hypothetical protein
MVLPVALYFGVALFVESDAKTTTENKTGIVFVSFRLFYGFS